MADKYWITSSARYSSTKARSVFPANSLSGSDRYHVTASLMSLSTLLYLLTVGSNCNEPEKCVVTFRECFLPLKHVFLRNPVASMKSAGLHYNLHTDRNKKLISSPCLCVRVFPNKLSKCERAVSIPTCICPAHAESVLP